MFSIHICTVAQQGYEIGCLYSQYFVDKEVLADFMPVERNSRPKLVEEGGAGFHLYVLLYVGNTSREGLFTFYETHWFLPLWFPFSLLRGEQETGVRRREGGSIIL